MLRATEIAGFVGAALAGVAYVPQIWHLIRERCSAGLSPTAFAVWLVASFLVTTHAIAIKATVFIALGAIQLGATALVLVYTVRYRTRTAPDTSPRSPWAKRRRRRPPRDRQELNSRVTDITRDPRAAVARLGGDSPELAELDINPLIVSVEGGRRRRRPSEGGACAAEPATRPAPNAVNP